MSNSAPLVLIVEDEPLVRELAGLAISEAGFEIIEAADAHEALAILKSRGDVGVLCTDVNMPGTLDGYALAKVVNEQWPSIKLVVTSGRALPGPLPGNGRFIAKPYSLEALGQTVATVSSADQDKSR
jgi:CheY-like chemotaxis protein